MSQIVRLILIAFDVPRAVGLDPPDGPVLIKVGCDGSPVQEEEGFVALTFVVVDPRVPRVREKPQSVEHVVPIAGFWGSEELEDMMSAFEPIMTELRSLAETGVDVGTGNMCKFLIVEGLDKKCEWNATEGEDGTSVGGGSHTTGFYCPHCWVRQLTAARRTARSARVHPSTVSSARVHATPQPCDIVACPMCARRCTKTTRHSCRRCGAVFVQDRKSAPTPSGTPGRRS